MNNRFNLNMYDYIEQPEGKLFFNRQMFGHIASKYDIINRVLSFDRDKTWKKRLVEDLPEAQAPYCLDIACGTGDITFRLAAKYPAGRIVGFDLTESMIDLAKTRGTFANITFAIGDMCRMSYADDSFDIVTGGYALRNAPNLEQAILEIWRVMKPGATAAFLDFSKSPNRFLQTAQDFLLRFWGGFWGILLHRNPQLYTYIAASLRQFPDSAALKQLIGKLGFINIRSRKHFFGFTETIFFQKP
ncbi:MAG: ubiquinone/menaquinone biosynthesis methyltransferase [Sedimentisphaerales bacterium]